MHRVRQQGAALITAVFLITALAALGALMSRLVVHGSIVTVNEYLSSRALLAAESGFDWAIYDILYNSGGGGDGQTGGPVALNGWEPVWFDTTVQVWNIDVGGSDPRTYYEVTSVGTAGGSDANPLVQRTLTLQFMP